MYYLILIGACLIVAIITLGSTNVLLSALITSVYSFVHMSVAFYFFDVDFQTAITNGWLAVLGLAVFFILFIFTPKKRTKSGRADKRYKKTAEEASSDWSFTLLGVCLLAIEVGLGMLFFKLLAYLGVYTPIA